MKGALQALVVCAGMAGGLMAFSSGPPVKRTGFAADGGLNCTACHDTNRPANSDPRGKLELILDQATYRPGVKQTIKVRISHPEAARWGFQLTARSVNSPTEMAGGFAITSDVRVRCDDGSALGTFATGTTGGLSCGGSREFASHSATSNRSGTRSGVEWEVEWTPPANEVGRIILSAAGNAANASADNTGDWIYTTEKTIEAEGACTLTKRPTLRSLGNAGSFATTLSPNALASVFGSDFQVAGRRRSAGPGDFVSGVFPKELACVAVEIGGARAPITYLQSDQINFQVPTGTATGPVPVMIILNPGKGNELRSDLGSVTVAQYAPAWFTFGGKSIAATTADGTAKIIADPSVVPGGIAAKRGDVVTLYGTGFGMTRDVFQAGELPTRAVTLRDPFTITVGGTRLADSDILYAGLAPTLISGLYQFNIRIPQSTTPGSVPVVVTIGGSTTQTAGGTIPVQ